MNRVLVEFREGLRVPVPEELARSLAAADSVVLSPEVVGATGGVGFLAAGLTRLAVVGVQGMELRIASDDEFLAARLRGIGDSVERVQLFVQGGLLQASGGRFTARDH